jgi:hypothetical protein
MEGAADGGVTVPVASSGAGALGDDRIIDGDEKVDTKQHLAMLWMFIAFLVGTALKYMLAVRTRETKNCSQDRGGIKTSLPVACG